MNFLNKFTSSATNRAKPLSQMQETPLAQAPSVPNPVLTVKNSGGMPFFMLTEHNLMNDSQKLLLLRELLSLPKDLQEFLTDEMQKSNSKLINSLLQENKKTILNKISAQNILNILSANTPDASKKLMEMICELSKTQNTGAQKELKELFNFMNSVNLSVQTSDANQIIKNFVIFYLPWLPLDVKNNKNDFDIEFFEENSSEKTEEKFQTAKVSINTLNWGLVRAVFELKFPSDLLVLIYAEDNFPSSMIEKLFYEKTKSMSINSKMVKEKTASVEVQKNKIKNQSVKINADSSINSYLLFAIYSLIRLVIETDKNALSSN